MKKPFYYGGQAVIEGVMMMGPEGYAISVRRPDGSIATRKERHHSIKEKWGFLKWPVIRGFVNLIEMLVLGMSTITWSANQSAEEEEELSAKEMALSVGIAVVAVLALFLVLPTWAGTALRPYIGDFGRSLLEGVLRIAVFLIYLLLIRRMDDILRVFRYHGAEHKTINAYEAGAALTPEAVSAYSTRHLRCGTSFVLMVMIMMILVFTFVGQTETTWARVLIKLVCMPFVAGLTYEFTRFSAGHCGNPIVRALITPGLWLQRLTTEEPDLDQLAVAIRSLKAVIPDYAETHPEEEVIIDYREEAAFSDEAEAAPRMEESTTNV
ncbi:MAG: DUF1385 domain-containing protein [Bacillota bacterium]|jgi:uncharacterized protein YqhQ